MSNPIIWLFIFIVSLFFLIKASDYFTDAAEIIGISIGLNPFIVGVTIVSLGTSLPELVSSSFAVYQNASEIVVGNVIGSNIANIFLIVGITSIFATKLEINYNLNDIDIPFFVGSAFLLFLTLLNGDFSAGEAVLCLVAYLVYLGYTFTTTENSNNDLEPSNSSSTARRKISLPKQFFVVIVSSLVIFLGAKYTIESVVNIAEIINLDAEIIAVSAVAIGTSLPELIVSITASKKGQSEIVIGNILGSNIFNVLVVMGIPGLWGSLVIPEPVISRDLPVMLVATILFFFATQDQQVSRWEGWLFIVLYIWFIGNLFNLV